MARLSRGAGLLLALGASVAASAETSPPAPLEYQFEIAMTRGRIFNPWTLADDPVELRAYRSGGNAAGTFVAPTLRVRPGQRLAIGLDNRLPACAAGRPCFNNTNLHTHGLWVSPSGNSDNVLVSVAPGERFRYEYDIPADHPAGTFWYHPHRHGTGLVQVGSGMAGALIVSGDRVPTADRPGDVDILLRDRDGPFRERVLLFQQIQYGCLDATGAIQGPMENGRPIRPWVCAPGETGRIESPNHDTDWRFSGRFTGINGEVQPMLSGARAGRFERWRLIHGGTREPVHLRLFRLAPDAPDLRTVRAGDQAAWIARHCAGEPLTVWQVALDGLTRSSARRADEAVLFPGERMDILTYFPGAGRYCLIQDTSRRGVGGSDPWRRGGENDPSRVLALLQVRAGDAAVADPAAALQARMIAAAERALAGPDRAAVRARVVGDLRNDLQLGAFVWHRSVEETEVTGYRENLLNILEPPSGPLFHINGRQYHHDRVDHVLPLGGVEEWHVRSLLGGHPLHIHVNPFQIMSIVDAQGRDVTDPNGPAYDPDYAGLVGQWKDTIFVKQGHRAIFRTRYERFTGDFVIHCHILFHGDHGMMQNLRIAAPGDAAPLATHH